MAAANDALLAADTLNKKAKAKFQEVKPKAKEVLNKAISEFNHAVDALKNMTTKSRK